MLVMHTKLSYNSQFSTLQTPPREELMRKSEEIVSWVVFQISLKKHPMGGIAICGQEEWNAMESACPGYHTLIKQGIRSEVEAERFARSQPGVTPEPKVRLKSRA